MQITLHTLNKFISQNINVDVDLFMQKLSFNNTVADLFISNVCNLKCKHCYFGSSKNIGAPLTLIEWIDAIHLLYSVGIRHFHLSGKESSMCPDTLGIIRHIKATYPDCYVGLVSNGTGDYDYYEKLLLNNIDYIEFSIDGLESTHNFVRRKNVFEIVKNNLSLLRKHVDKLNISTCLNTLNLQEYFEVIKVFYKLGIRRFFVTPFLEKGFGADFKEYSVSSEDLDAFLESLFAYIKEKENSGIVIKVCIDQKTTRDLWDYGKFAKQQMIDYLRGDSELIYRFGENIIQISYTFIDIDFYYNLSITNDGYILSCSDHVSHIQYSDISLCNIRNISKDQLQEKRFNSIYNQLTNLNI